MVKTWEITIPELTGREKRRAYVYLPDSYDQKPNKRYPVLYMFDGHNVFFDEDATYGKSWGLKRFLESRGTEIIVAAVECNHSPDHGRLKEYSPFTFSDETFGEIEGRGKITMDWMVKTFKPYIDKHYRTFRAREYTWIAGSSMGGLMSVYALMEYNSTFSRAAALSPSLWTDVEQVAQMIENADLGPDTVLYMDYGSDELINHEGMLPLYADMTALLLKKGVYLDSRIVPGGNHSEASWERQIPFFMHTLRYNIKWPQRKRGAKAKKTEVNVKKTE
ncbi:MAG: alpha/beta hydrolase [Lachnospiraceae bacterium]|nr:alpha/beta hydrolase [Lachnospiraceae bacterium]